MRRDVAFLCAVTDDSLFARLTASIAELERPVGVEAEVFAVRGRMNLPRAYNRLLELSRECRYKVYVHQDVTFLNRRFIGDLLRLFRRRTIGLVGMAGCRFLPPSYVWWDGSGLYGNVLEDYPDGPGLLTFEQPEGDYAAVECVDGLCIATQYDLAWDEAIPGADFYDVAQSTRFLLRGYEVVVPRQPEPWCFHGHTPPEERDWAPYYAARDVFADRYGARRDRFVRSRVRRRARRLATRARLAVTG